MKILYQKLKEKVEPFKNYIKIFISISILIIIFNKIDTKTTLSMLTSLSLPILIILLGISLFKFFTQATNWFYCLKINDDYKSSYANVLKTHMIGLALRFFMPGGHATFGKVFYVKHEKKKNIFFSIVLEKFFQSWIIWFFAVWALLFYQSSYRVIIIIAGLILTIIPFILPIIFRKHINHITQTNYFNALPKILSSQIIFETLTFIQYYLIIQFFVSTKISFLGLSTNIALILIANTIPITFSGLGLRETASALLLPRIGIPIETAVGASLIIFLFNAVIPAIPGALFIITHKK